MVVAAPLVLKSPVRPTSSARQLDDVASLESPSTSTSAFPEAAKSVRSFSTIATKDDPSIVASKDILSQEPPIVKSATPPSQNGSLSRASSAPHRTTVAFGSDLARSLTLPSSTSPPPRAPGVMTHGPVNSNSFRTASESETETESSTAAASNANPTPVNTHTVASPTSPSSPSTHHSIPTSIANLSEAFDSNLRKQTPPAHPFAKPLPTKTHFYYRQPLEPGQKYAFYTLVPLPPGKLEKLQKVFARNAEEEFTDTTVVASPLRHDFTGATVRDAYDHHITLLSQSSLHKDAPEQVDDGIAGARFLVVLQQEWEEDGLMLVEFDVDGDGSLGCLRINADQAVSLCLMFERGGSWMAWEDMKEWEAGVEWRSAVEGYTGSELENFGRGS